MASVKSAADVAQSWVNGMQGSVDKIRKGVQAVQESPGAAAARSADLWQQNVSSSRAKQKFVNSTNSLSLSSWQNSVLNKGINRVASGATAAQGKFQTFMSQFLPHVQAVAAQVRQMPKNNLEDSIQRMIAQVRGNAQFNYSK